MTLGTALAVTLVAILVGVGTAILLVRPLRPSTTMRPADVTLLDSLSWPQVATDRFGRLVELGTVVVLKVDLDHFSRVNTRLGRPAGDAVLAAAGSVILAQAGRLGVAARLPGDQFALLVTAGRDDVDDLARHIQREIGTLAARAAGHAGRPAVGRLTMSIGAAVYPGDGKTLDALMLAADVLLLAAKNAGKDRVCVSRQAPDIESLAS